jgi:hypothetical protein
VLRNLSSSPLSLSESSRTIDSSRWMDANYVLLIFNVEYVEFATIGNNDILCGHVVALPHSDDIFDPRDCISNRHKEGDRYFRF